MKGYIPTLDGWRAVAITAVMVFHGATNLFYPNGPYPSYDALRIVQAGAKGVDIFFAISGFLICTRLLQEEKESGTISLQAFYLRRAFRILPPYFTYLGVLAMIAGAGVVVVDAREWWSCVCFVRNYVGHGPTSTGWYTTHFWSLSVEEHFYLFWPLFLVVCGPGRARRFAAPLALAVLGWTYLNYQFDWLTELGPITRRTDTRLDGLIWGCWAAMLVDVPAWRARIGRWLNRWVWLAMAAALVGLARYQPPLESNLGAILLPWLVVGTVLHPSSPLGRVLECRPIRWVGRLSYSLYIWQQIFLLGSWRVTRPFPFGRFQELPLSVVATFACAIASYYLVERPALRFGQRLARAVADRARNITSSKTDEVRSGSDGCADRALAPGELLTVRETP